MHPNFNMKREGGKSKAVAAKANAPAAKKVKAPATKANAPAAKKINVPLIMPKAERDGKIEYAQMEFSHLQGAEGLKNLVKIGRESRIELIILKYPQLAMDLMEAGMHCIGCPAAEYETLYGGCIAHGMEEKEIDKLIASLNKKIKK